MNALATRSKNKKPLFKNTVFTNFDESRFADILNEKCTSFSPADSLPAKFNFSDDDLIESYEEFEKDFGADQNNWSSLGSIVQLNELLLTKVNIELE